jgi:hypothetical protein
MNTYIKNTLLGARGRRLRERGRRVRNTGKKA